MPPTWFDDALALYPAEYGVRVRGMARELYRNDNPTTEVAWFATDTVHVGGLRWTVSSWPMSSVQGLYRSDLREVIAVLGVIVSILVSLLLRLLHFTQAAARTVERERLQQALDSSTDGLWEQDLDTGESHRSEGVWRGLGYDPHTLTPRGATAVWDSLIHPEDRPRVQRALEEHLAGRTDTLDVEARLQARDGEWHWIVERGRVVERGPDGRPVRMLGAIADVTERKHAVQALAASERRFRAMFDGGAQIEMLLDLDCTCLEANRVALDFAGIPLTQMRGKIIWETPSWAGSPVRVERLRKACDEAKLGKIRAISGGTRRPGRPARHHRVLDQADSGRRGPGNPAARRGAGRHRAEAGRGDAPRAGVDQHDGAARGESGARDQQPARRHPELVPAGEGCDPGDASLLPLRGCHRAGDRPHRRHHAPALRDVPP